MNSSRNGVSCLSKTTSMSFERAQSSATGRSDDSLLRGLPGFNVGTIIAHFQAFGQVFLQIIELASFVRGNTSTGEAALIMVIGISCTVFSSRLKGKLFVL